MQQNPSDQEIQKAAAEKVFNNRVDRLWRNYSLGELVTAAVSVGYGSGEELFEYLTIAGLSSTEAQTVVDLLNKAAGFHSYPEGGSK